MNLIKWCNSFLVKQLNNKYDLRGVMYLGALKLLAIILRKPLKNAANKWQKDKDYFCSELCYEALVPAAWILSLTYSTLT